MVWYLYICLFDICNKLHVQQKHLHSISKLRGSNHTSQTCIYTLKMVRIISQKTYDDVVRENIDEFGMSVEEAIEDAIKQFEAQV